MDAGTKDDFQEKVVARAKLLGWERQYAKNPMFKEKFDEMHAAVEALPAELIDRGRLLDYPQLHMACVGGDLELVKALLDAGIGVDSYTYTDDEDDFTPLVWLAQDEDMDPEVKLSVAKLLLKRGADADEGDAAEVAEDAGNDDFAEFLRGV